jgi:hypothetical protein
MHCANFNNCVEHSRANYKFVMANRSTKNVHSGSINLFNQLKSFQIFCYLDFATVFKLFAIYVI